MGFRKVVTVKSFVGGRLNIQWRAKIVEEGSKGDLAGRRRQLYDEEEVCVEETGTKPP